MAGASTFTYVETKTYTWVASTVTLNTNGKTIGASSLPNLVLI